MNRGIAEKAMIVATAVVMSNHDGTRVRLSSEL
jgi:hypothetical protein